MHNEQVIQYMNYLTKTYAGLTKLIAATHQRLQSLPGAEEGTDCDTMLKGDGKAAGLLTVKGRIERAIEKELPQWDVWEMWLKKVPGIGPVIGSKLIMLFNYRFTPICQDCGGVLDKEDGAFVCRDCKKKAKGDGVLKHKMENRNFETVSKWWAFMGRHTVDGAIPKRKAGVVSNWSSEGRTLGFHIGDQFNRQKPEHLYKQFMVERKQRHAKNHPDWKPGHCHNAARNEAAKLFLSHFWSVSRELDGKETKTCYAEGILGHENIIAPYYW
jgi:hypothetical protein